LSGNRRLAAHRVNRYDAALQQQQVEQGGNGSDLVALGIGLPVPRRDGSRRPCTDEVDRRLARSPIMRAACRFAINRDHLPIGLRDRRTHPREKTLRELAAVKGRENTPKGVVRGNTGVNPYERTMP